MTQRQTALTNRGDRFSAIIARKQFFSGWRIILNKLNFKMYLLPQVHSIYPVIRLKLRKQVLPIATESLRWLL